MNIHTDGYPLPVSKRLVEILQQAIEKADLASSPTVIVNFRDPTYGAETGGFHPVEVMITEGRIQYVTDFAYVGAGPWAELDKDLDFDFAQGVFQQQGRVYPIHQGLGLFRLWQQNFCEYWAMGVFEVSVTVG